MNQDKIPITQEGLKELQETHRNLVEEKRPAVVKRMSDSRSIGDMVEDNEYSQAKQELAFIDGKINELDEVINRAAVVDVKKIKCDQVTLGCQVTVEARGNQHVFHLVGEWEADPASMKISHQSPIGQALLGKKVGEKVEVEAPVGKIVYHIKEIN